MNWDCTNTEERLSDFLDGAMSAEEASVFAAHEAGCTHCAELVARVGGLVRRMQRVEAVEIPEQLVSNILGATLGPRKTQRGLEGWFGSAQAVWQPRFAMGFLTVASSFVIVMHAAGVNPATISWSDLNPANVVRSANRQAHLAYGRAEKFVDDLQVVYEIRSQLEPEATPQEVTPAESAPAGETAPGRSPGSSPQEQKQPQPAPSVPPKAEARPQGGVERSRNKMSNGRLLAMLERTQGLKSLN